MLKQEQKLLREHYLKCAETVKNNSLLTLYAKEKLIHSLQVFGAGLFICKHEPHLNNFSEPLKEKALTAVLLHDIGRFAEITATHANPDNHPDHGILGSEILKNIPQYNDIRITLSVKHHGHMIEELYDDPEYKQIKNKELRHEVEKITFLIRDADKIANFYLFNRKAEEYHKLIFDEISSENINKGLSPHILEYFLNQKVIPTKEVCSLQDRIISIICWIFDLNYAPSFKFLQDTAPFGSFFTLLDKHNSDKKLQKTIVKNTKNYINSRYHQLKG